MASTLIAELSADSGDAALAALREHLANNESQLSASALANAAHVAALHNNARALAALPVTALAHTNSDGLLPAHVAAQHGHVAALEVLHSRSSAPIDSSVLFAAVRGAQVEAVRFIIDVCHVAVNGFTPAGSDSVLMCAVRTEHLATVRLLCDRGADVHWRGRDSDALLLAVRSGHVAIARALLDAGADVNVRVGNDLDTQSDANEFCTALTLAARTNNAEMTQLLIERGANVNVFATAEKDDVYGTHLVQACLADALEPARLIVRAGADPNTRNSQGFTPLMSLARLGNFDAVKCIVAVGADCATVHTRHGSALMQAAALGHALIVAFLAKLGQSVNQMDASNGRTPLMLASVGGHATAVRCLVDLGARLNVTDRAGYTALMLAAHRGHADVAHVLVAGGADASIAIKLSVFKKLTALSLAKSGNHRAVVQLLAASQKSPDRKARQQQILTKKDE
jgi:ankyrin repeat protein